MGPWLKHDLQKAYSCIGMRKKFRAESALDKIAHHSIYSTDFVELFFGVVLTKPFQGVGDVNLRLSQDFEW